MTSVKPLASPGPAHPVKRKTLFFSLIISIFALSACETAQYSGQNSADGTPEPESRPQAFASLAQIPLPTVMPTPTAVPAPTVTRLAEPSPTPVAPSPTPTTQPVPTAVVTPTSTPEVVRGQFDTNLFTPVAQGIAAPTEPPTATPTPAATATPTTRPTRIPSPTAIPLPPTATPTPVIFSPPPSAPPAPQPTATPAPIPTATATPTPTPHASDCIDVPDGLPTSFSLGLGNRPQSISWMRNSGIPWDFRYQYLTGDVTDSPWSGSRWAGWNSPPGRFALNYMNDSADEGYIPVFTYYTLFQTGPNSWSENLTPKFNSSSTMKDYFEDWKLLMEQAAEFGGTVIVQHEPDAWGWIQKRNDDPKNTYVSVNDTGLGELSGYPDNAAGFAQALVDIRDYMAPNVILAWHASHWADGVDFTFENGSSNQAVNSGRGVASFYNSLGADFDLIFTDPSDRDWGYLKTVEGESNHQWNDATFSRFNQFVGVLYEDTGVPQMLWQLPLGNTIFRTMNNSNGHYQDNHVQYFLQNGSVDHIQEHISNGVIGLLFGRGNGSQTSYLDARGNGVTNPSPINGNNQTSVWSDDDGGLMRIRANNYYNNGPVALPTCAG